MSALLDHIMIEQVIKIKSGCPMGATISCFIPSQLAFLLDMPG